MVKIVVKHEAKPSILWPIETSLEYLYERTARPFHALINLLYRGQFKGNNGENTVRTLRKGQDTTATTRRGKKAAVTRLVAFLATPWLPHSYAPTWVAASLAELC